MLVYRPLSEFANDVSSGKINLSNTIALKSMDHNMIHNISFIDHCKYLCEKHDTNLLRLLTVILQKLNGDMILRVNKYPQLSDKIQSAIGEWDEKIEPIDLFRCPNNCYDCNNLYNLKNTIKGYDDEFSKVNTENDDNNLYEILEDLKTKYYNGEEEIRNNLLEIEEKYNDFDMPISHRKIFDDLSTRPKSFYMEKLLEDNNHLNNNVNMRLVNGIPENIHVIFLNGSLLSTLISKCMEGHKKECLTLKDLLSKKNIEIDDLMSRVGPGIPLSENLLNMFEGIKSYFEDNNDDLPSDDDDEEEEIDESSIQNALNSVLNKKSDDLNIKELNNSDEPKNETIYHLSINPTTKENNKDDKDKDDKDKDDNGDNGDNISFFD